MNDNNHNTEHELVQVNAYDIHSMMLLILPIVLPVIMSLYDFFGCIAHVIIHQLAPTFYCASV